MRTKSRSSLRQLAFCAGITLTFLSAQLLAQETTGGDHHFEYSQVGIFSGENFGLAVASLGDINADGTPDLAVGAPFATISGEVKLIDGANGNLLPGPFAPNPSESFGSSLTGTGDLDGDGIADFAVGAKLASPGGLAFAGSVYVYSGASLQLLYRIDGTAISDFLGESIASIQDLDGDGIDDLLISQSGWQGASIANIGSVMVVSGASGNLIRRIEGTELSTAFATALATVDDTDGDGIQDILVGAYLSDPNFFSNAGSAYLYSGATGTLLQRLDGNAGMAGFGVALSSAGDVDQDGADDLLIGANQFGLQSGEAYVYSGATGALIYTYEGGQNSRLFGSAVSPIGDLNGDGIPDQMVGDWRESVNQAADTGAVYFYSGADGSLMQRIAGDQDGGAMGYAVAQVGASTDFILGAPHQADPFATLDTGRIHVGSVDSYLSADSIKLSAATGGTLTYQLDFPDSMAGNKAWLAVSFAGPGFALTHGVKIPLALSDLLTRTLDAPWPGAIATLDAFGDGTANLQFAPNELLDRVGQRFEICAIGVDPVGSLPMRVSVQAILDVQP